MIGLWLSLNHPKAGRSLREAVSDGLRREGRVHLTVHAGEAGLVLASGQELVEAAQLLAVASRDRVLLYAAGRDPPVLPVRML